MVCAHVDVPSTDGEVRIIYSVKHLEQAGSLQNTLWRE